MSQISPAETPRDPEPPLPPRLEDINRWKHTRLRRRLLYGQWDDDLRELVVAAAGTKRADAWKMIDLSANVFRASMQQVAVQYDRRPFVLHAEDLGRQVAQLAASGQLWGLMPRMQRDTLGLREGLVRVDLVKDPDDGWRPIYRQVTPDYVTGTAHPDAPGRPGLLREAILRDGPGGEQVWTWEVWDTLPGHEPSVRCLDTNGDDCSPLYLRRADGSPAPIGGLVGRDYTWRSAAGVPFLPYAAYHASYTGRLWDPYEARELVAGSLNIALMWSLWGHLLRNAAWLQRFSVGARPVGTRQGGDQAGRSVVQADAATIMMFEVDEAEGGQGVVQLGAFPQPADPMVAAEAVALYERRIAAFAGINPADIQRVAGDPRSGYALAVTREGQREAQVRFEPQFRLGDERVLWITAQLLRRATGRPYPTSGYELQYQTVPKSLEELRAEREDVFARLDHGLIDKVAAYRRFHPGVGDEDAARALLRIQAVNRELGTSVDPALAVSQTQSIMAVVRSVAAGEMPAAGAAALLRVSYGLSETEADAMLAGAEDLAQVRTTRAPAAPAGALPDQP